MATLKDIAQKVGVSIRAVSHAVNNTGRLSAETRRIILEAVAEMGYYPDAAARSLVTHRSKLLGVMVPFLSTSFYGQIISGLEEIARDTERDNFMTSEEAKEFGIIDRVLERH